MPACFVQEQAKCNGTLAMGKNFGFFAAVEL